MGTQYRNGDEILEVCIRDETGAKIEVRRCNRADEIQCGRILVWLRDKWGIRFKIDKGFIEFEDEFLKY